MSNSKPLNEEVELFKYGDSFAFKMSQKDLEFMDGDETTHFEKIVSSDGKSITFKKIEHDTSDTSQIANRLYHKHEKLMKRLADL